MASLNVICIFSESSSKPIKVDQKFKCRGRSPTSLELKVLVHILHTIYLLYSAYVAVQWSICTVHVYVYIYNTTEHVRMYVHMYCACMHTYVHMTYICMECAIVHPHTPSMVDMCGTLVYCCTLAILQLRLSASRKMPLLQNPTSLFHLLSPDLVLPLISDPHVL